MRLRALISRRSPFLPPLPDDRISLCVYADETGFRYWNRSSDPMPIKTTNMAGLQKWEETDDYIIYLDKDAVMTTVANYVTGTYDLFKERKADIDRAMDLLKINNIEWTSEDDSKLLLDINKAQLERIANTPTTMEEEDFTPQTFTTRAVPTTYECCFRVDKSSGEIYIWEGYENLLPTEAGWGGTISVMDSNGISTFTKRLPAESVAHVKLITKTTFAPGVKFSVNYEIIQDGNEVNFKYLQSYSGGMVETGVLTGFKNSGSFLIKENYHQDNILFWFTDKIVENSYVKAKIQITKTSTPKPFVKSVMPSGKLAFVTNVTDTTHTFLNKGDGVVTVGTGEFNIVSEKIEQLLVYKGLLTQAEKDVELAKNIRLK